MRKVFYILVIMMCSCVGRNEAVNEKSEENLVSDTNALELTEESFDVEDLIIDKLNEYFELLELKRNHPEFKETVVSQLKKISRDSIFDEDYQDAFEIKNIIKSDEVTKLSDSVQKLKLYYEVFSKNGSYKDSIYSYVITNKILFEGRNNINTKVEFSKTNE